ncbi:MAG: hypothetical protein ACQEXQ_19155 [Bacillota bacterium]
MKFRMIVLLLAFVAVVVVSGCTNNKDESKVTLENVIQAIQAEGPELISRGQVDVDALDDVKGWTKLNGYSGGACEGSSSF